MISSEDSDCTDGADGADLVGSGESSPESTLLSMAACGEHTSKG